MAKKNPAAVSLGRKGGMKRAEALSPEERSEQAKKAATSRWAKSAEVRSKKAAVKRKAVGKRSPR